MDTIETILATCPTTVEPGAKVRIEARSAPMVREAIASLKLDERGLRLLCSLPRSVYMALMRKGGPGYSIYAVDEDAAGGKLRVFMARNQQPLRPKRARAPRKGEKGAAAAATRGSEPPAGTAH